MQHTLRLCLNHAAILGVLMIATLMNGLAHARAQAITGGQEIEQPPPDPEDDQTLRVLVFSKTAGFRHDSIPDGVEAIRKLGAENGFAVDHTEDAAAFTDDNLKKYKAVVFLSTTGRVFGDDDERRDAFQRYIRAGGGYVGVHAAADTEYDWPWYGDLVGAYFAGHPHIQEADIIVLDRAHPSTHHLAQKWSRTDEWYNYRAQPKDGVTVLLNLDETTYEGGTMGAIHPITWCHKFDGGRAWYTGLGHTKESFKEPEFLTHLLGGIHWAAGVGESRPSTAKPSGGVEID